MATFKVNQRVRITCAGGSAARGFPPGREGTVIADADSAFVVVSVDGLPHDPGRLEDGWFVNRQFLRPLTDPSAESFIADMKRFAKIAGEPLPMHGLTEREIEVVRGR